jgi:pimeloyl-ACP methyl ester carboxylesterase
MIKGSSSSSGWVPGRPRRHSVACISPAGLHRMAYQEWGDPSNPNVVICVHGLTRVGDDFATLAQALESDFRVVCPDVVGRGRSDWLKNPMLYGVPQYASDMVTLLARLNVQRARWVGTSMGGLVGMTLAALEGSPITHLVLNDVGAVLSGKALSRIASYVGVSTEFAGREQAHAALRAIFSGFGPHSDAQWKTLLDAMLVPIDDAGRVRLHYDPAIAVPFQQTYAQAGAAGAPPADLDLWPIYEAIRCPTLILRGVQSDLLTSAVMAEMCGRGPHAKAVEFSGIGHAPTLMHEDQIRVVTEFLRTESSH